MCCLPYLTRNNIHLMYRPYTLLGVGTRVIITADNNMNGKKGTITKVDMFLPEDPRKAFIPYKIALDDGTEWWAMTNEHTVCEHSWFAWRLSDDGLYNVLEEKCWKCKARRLTQEPAPNAPEFPINARGGNHAAKVAAGGDSPDLYHASAATDRYRMWDGKAGSFCTCGHPRSEHTNIFRSCSHMDEHVCQCNEFKAKEGEQ